MKRHRRFWTIMWVLAVVPFLLIFQPYFRTFIWQSTHHGSTAVPGGNIAVPRYWREVESQKYGEVVIERAQYLKKLNAEIKVYPAIPGETMLDQQTLSRFFNALSLHESQGQIKATSSMFSLNGEKHQFTCLIRDWHISSFVQIQCRAPQLPTVLSYSGPREFVGEVKAAFLSFE